MIGLMGDPDPKTGKVKPLLRAYSIASPSWDEELEFYSIKVPNGPLTSKLQHIEPGDQIILRPKPVGTLVHDALIPGKRIWFFATGTGFAPFASSCGSRRPTRITTRSSSPIPAARWGS
jgi:ferredoxin--NADP+ reductase